MEVLKYKTQKLPFFIAVPPIKWPNFFIIIFLSISDFEKKCYDAFTNFTFFGFFMSSMSTNIGSFDHLLQLTRLHDLPITEIEQRARPGNYSTCGFLDSREGFKEVLERDWKVVQAMGFTHVEIAGYLSRRHCYRPEVNLDETLRTFISEVCKSQSIFKRFIHFIRFHFENFSLDSVSLIFSRFKNMVICSQTEIDIKSNGLCSCGFQEDIFENPRAGYLGERWGDCPTLTNSAGQKLVISTGGINYIRKYGFYQGNTPFRIDPVEAVALVTGLCSLTIQAYLERKGLDPSIFQKKQPEVPYSLLQRTCSTFFSCFRSWEN